MKWTVVLVVIALVLFAGCEKAKPTVTNSKNQTFLTVVRTEYPDLKSLSNARLIGVAHATCNALDNGASAEQVIMAIASSADTTSRARELGYVVGAGVAVYCPQYKNEFSSQSSF